MIPFIRVIEIWTPSASGDYLEFNDGIYGPLQGFAGSSKETTFKYGEVTRQRMEARQAGCAASIR